MCRFGSKDKRSNGPYALAGTCNCRPFYRLLGPSKRYLFFAHGANAWTGWWVAESLGSEEYVDRFVDASGSSAPSSCTGVLGSRLTPGTPTPEVFQNISLVSDHYEKVAIRSKFAEVLGDQVASLEQRAPHQPGIVGVARVLEVFIPHFLSHGGEMACTHAHTQALKRALAHTTNQRARDQTATHSNWSALGPVAAATFTVQRGSMTRCALFLVRQWLCFFFFGETLLM